MAFQLPVLVMDFLVTVCVIVSLILILVRLIR